MDYDLIFKINLILLYIAFTFIKIHFSRIARKKRTHGELKESKLRLTILQIYIIITVILFFLYIIRVNWFKWGEIIDYPIGLKWFGTTIGIFSILMFIWAHTFLGKNFSYTLKIFIDQNLITTGPYRFIRHPMYTAFILFHTSIFLMTGNWFIGLIWMGVITIILLLRIKKEEELLVEVFGNDYINYRKRTGILLPPFFKLFKKDYLHEIKNSNWYYKAASKNIVKDNNQDIFIDWLSNIVMSYKKPNYELTIRKFQLSESSDFYEENLNEKDFKQISKSQGIEDNSNTSKQIKFDGLLDDHELKITNLIDKVEENVIINKIEAKGSKKFVTSIKSNFERRFNNNQNYQLIYFGP